jgi:hypothetical protein
VVGVFETNLMRLQIFFSKTLPLCKFLQTISDNNEIQIWGFFFLASGGGPKGGKKKPNPIFHGFFKMDLYLPPL